MPHRAPMPPGADAPDFVAANLRSVRVWCAAVFGGFVLGVLPFSLLGLLVWGPIGNAAILAGPVAVVAILCAACREHPAWAGPGAD